MSKDKAKPPTVEAVAAALETPSPRVPAVPPEDLLSTGCTLLNMAFTGTPGGGVPKGGYLYLVGDSGAGKTWYTFNLFAEAARNRHFADHRFVFDNAENGALLDVATYFGRAVVDRLEPPAAEKDGTPVYSETVQQFYCHLESAVRAGPCIYVLDSMDALNDDADEEKFEAELHYHETGKGEKDIPGSMGMSKAKTNSKNINRVARTLRSNGSILAVISQTRDAVGSRIPGMKTRSGGRALRFFAHLEAWLSIKKPLTRTYLRKEREYGHQIQFDIQKNRLCGWHGKVPLVTFLAGHGVDDVGSNVDYLLDERHWERERKPSRGETDPEAGGGDADGGGGDANPTLSAPEFGFTGRKEALVRRIQEAGDEWDVAQLVARVWRDIAAGAAPVRKARYT